MRSYSVRVRKWVQVETAVVVDAHDEDEAVDRAYCAASMEGDWQPTGADKEAEVEDVSPVS